MAITVSGIYAAMNPTDAYWFGNPPIGSSGYDTKDQARSNPLFTVRDFGDAPGMQETLDLRLDRSMASVDELPELHSATSALAASPCTTRSGSPPRFRRASIASRPSGPVPSQVSDSCWPSSRL